MYPCQHCTEAFSSHAHLMRHVHTCHPETLVKPVLLGTKRKLVELSSDEEDYFNSQGGGDELCNQAMDAFEMVEPPSWALYPGMPQEQFRTATQQLGGNPLFDFEVNSVAKRSWLNNAENALYNTTLRQLRDPEEGDDIGVAPANAMETAVRKHLERLHAKDKDKVFLSITANGFEHAYQTVTFEVGPFLKGDEVIEEQMRKLAGKLNSNESFSPNQGFQLDITLIRPQSQGSGRHGKRLNPGHLGYELSRQTKNSIIRIKNENVDELCCARAIVTMQARSEWKVAEKRRKEEAKDAPDQTLLETLHREEKLANNKFKNIRQDRDEQKRLAKYLHKMAGVPEGPCGLPELQKFQTYLYTLSPPYQLKVFCDIVKKPVFTGSQKVDEDHILVLIKSPHHYDGCSSLPGFFNRGYWCHDCNKAFNSKDGAHHSCEGRVCKACQSKPCPDKQVSKKPQVECPDCHGLFYGPCCFQEHKTKKICESFKHCKNCSAEYRVIKGKPPHRCGFAKCQNCKQFVNIQEHQCYIQPEIDDDSEEIEELVLDPTEELDEAFAEGKKKLPPLFVYADIEAMTVQVEGERQFVPNLLCYQTSEEDQIHSLWGNNICMQFINTLKKLAQVSDGEKKCERPVIVIFHNLKGFDGTLLINTLYEHAHEVKNQFAIGAKVLCFQSGPLTFKDSLCFLNMPLAAFPDTFGLTEMKKGYFPHAFNTPENQNYRGRLPDKDYYDPEKMMEKEKEKFEVWYAEQEAKNEVFDLRKELESYCQSDVALLKAGCDAFVERFCEEADFNPFEKCMTIASACNKYWRRSIVPGSPASRIAVRPLRGWHGAQTNQSVKALQWLYYQESLIPKEGACADRIKHVKNGGEQKVWANNRCYSVDGYDAVTRRIYEFHGCLWHGCPDCFRGKRDMKRRIMPD